MLSNVNLLKGSFLKKSIAFALGPFTVDPVNARGTVVARVDPDLGTDLQEAALTDADPIACPSVFTTGFRLVGPSLPDRPSVSVTIVDATGRTVERAIGLGEKLGEGLAPGAYTVLVRSGVMLSLTRVVKAE